MGKTAAISVSVASLFVICAALITGYIIMRTRINIENKLNAASAIAVNAAPLGGAAPSAATAKTPGPESYGEYDKYKGEQHALYGGIRRIIVPPAVGYGVPGHGPIPGNAVLVFDVQLIAVN